MKSFNIKVIEEFIYWVEVSADTKRKAEERVIDNDYDSIIARTQETVSINVLEIEEVEV